MGYITNVAVVQPTGKHREIIWTIKLTDMSIRGQELWISIAWKWYLNCCHVTWWRHQMKTFSTLLALCAGNSPVTGEFPSQRPETRSFDVFFELRLNKRLSEAGDLRRHCAHYDVIVMISYETTMHLHLFFAAKTVSCCPVFPMTLSKRELATEGQLSVTNY